MLFFFLLCADGSTSISALSPSLTRAIQLTQEKTPTSLAEARLLVTAESFVGEELKQARVLRCEIALAEHLADEFVKCTKGLAKDYPSSPEALYYGHHGQVAAGRYREARQLLEAAHENGLPAVLYDEAKAKLDALAPPLTKWFVLGGLLVFLVVLVAFKPWRKVRV